VKVGGGDGGHNGLKSLRQHLGPDFVRVRFGIGRPPQGWDPADFVLAKFAAEEEAVVEEQLPKAADAAATALLEGTAVAMNRFNRRPKEASGEKGEAQGERRSRLGRRRAEAEGSTPSINLAGSANSGKPKR
jgi:PTH1 family peptidyl-tRNA hydrolase